MIVRCILHIDLDAFFVSAEQTLNPELRGKPVIVGGHPKRGVVSSASYEARAFGIKAGMPLTKARRLCPQAIFLQGNFHLYRDISSRFMKILADFSPSLEPLGLDEAYVDITGCESVYGQPREVALNIKERIKRELGLTASIGIASSKVVAKIASSICKPDGLLQVTPGEERHFLAPLPVAELPGVGRKAELVLKEMRVTTIGELAALPPALVKRRFGATGIVIHHYANGIDDRKVEPPGEAKSISRETTFTKDTGDRRFLEATLHYLSERIGAELRQQGRQARCITTKVRYANFETISRSLTLKEASDADQVIFTTALQLFNKALAQKQKLVRLVGVEVSSLVSGGKQLHMFDPTAKRLEYLDRAIDHIRRKYGFTSIQTGRTLPLKGNLNNGRGDCISETPSPSGCFFVIARGTPLMSLRGARRRSNLKSEIPRLGSEQGLPRFARNDEEELLNNPSA